MLKPIAFVLAAALALLAAPAKADNETFPVTHNEPITVRILNGKNGQPLAHIHLILIGGYDQGEITDHLWQEEKLTDEQGQVRLSGQLVNLPRIQVELLKGKLCQVKPESVSFSVERIRRDGLSAPNRCGIATVQDAPGIFIVFVKNKVKRKGTKTAPPTPGYKNFMPTPVAGSNQPAPPQPAPSIAFAPLEALPIATLPLPAEAPQPDAMAPPTRTGIQPRQVLRRRHAHRQRRASTVCQVPAPTTKAPTEEAKSKHTATAKPEPATTATRKPANPKHKAIAGKRPPYVRQTMKKTAAPTPPAPAPPTKPAAPAKK
jgi:hypothetical protein